MFETSTLEAFVAVSEFGSFSAAASKLQISQPRISLQIRRLEDQLGFSLFVRTTRRVTLTDDGHTFRPFATQILDAQARASRVAGIVRTRGRNEITIGAPLFTAEVPQRADLLRRFIGEFPNVALRVRHGVFEEQIQDLKDHLIDFLLTVTPFELSEQIAVSLEVAQAKLCIGAPKDHDLVRLPTLSLAHLANREVAVLPRLSNPEGFDRWFGGAARAGVRLIECPESAVSTLVQFGVARSIPVLLYRWEIEVNDYNLDWRPCDEDAIRLLLVRMKDKRLHHAAKLFWDLASKSVTLD